MIQTFQLQANTEPFPGYRLNRLLGSGGYSEVWRSSSPNGHDIALKFMRVDDGSAAAHEVRAIQSLKEILHPNLTPIQRVWLLPGFIVFAMEQADGTLHDLLHASFLEFGTALAPKIVCRYLLQIARAIDFLNERRHQLNGHPVGFIHGDIKPTNMLIFRDKIKLADFGTARPITHRRVNTPPRGTIEYAAPEVFDGWLTDSSDQYSLAVSYCLLRGGSLPFSEIPQSFRNGASRPLPVLDKLPAVEQPIIARALNPVPQNRWPSCEAMMSELGRVYSLSNLGLAAVVV